MMCKRRKTFAIFAAEDYITLPGKEMWTVNWLRYREICTLCVGNNFKSLLRFVIIKEVTENGT